MMEKGEWKMKQKGFMVVFLLVFDLLVGMCAANASDTLAPGSGYVNNGSSKNIYTQPDTSSDVIGILPTGQDFEILTVHGTWLEIECYHLASGREVGWITSENIAQDKPYTESLHNQPTIPLVTQRPPKPTQPSQPQAPTPVTHTQPSGVIQGYGIIHNGGVAYPVNVYSKANAGSKVMGSYYQGVEAAYYDNAPLGWVKISVGSIQGYVSADHFSFVNSPSEVTLALPVYIVKNTTSTWVNLRAEPSLSADKLGEYYNGRVALVYGTVGDWSYLKIEGKTGYIMTQYLKMMTPKRAASTSAMREYQAFSTMPDYSAQASAYEIQPGEFNMQVELEFGPSYSTNSPITSYNVYINGAFAGNIQPVDSSGAVVSPKEFQGYANFDGDIVSIMLIPVCQPSNEEFFAEILAFG